MSVLVRLRELKMQYVYGSDGLLSTLPASVFEAFRHLTHLDLSHMVVDDINLAVGGLRNVRVLRLHDVQSAATLSAHTLLGLTDRGVLDVHHTQYLQADFRLAPLAPIVTERMLPRSLRELRLRGNVTLDPAVLAGVQQQLTVLDLHEIDFERNEVEGGVALIEAIQKLSQLRTLSLTGTRVEWPAPCAFAGLLSSPDLESFEQRWCGWPMAAGVWDHMLAAEASWPCGLKTFTVVDWREWEGIEDADPSRFWDVMAVSKLVALSPRLQEVDLLVRGCAAVSVLCSLTGLTRLRLGLKVGGLAPQQQPDGDVDVEVDDSNLLAAVVAIASSLTNLCSLCLRAEPAAAVAAQADFLPLTALRALTECQLDMTAYEWTAQNKVSAGVGVLCDAAAMCGPDSHS